MSYCNSVLPHAANVLGVEEPKRLFRRSFQSPSNNRQTGVMGVDAQEQVTIRTENKPEVDASFCVFAEQVYSKEAPTRTEDIPIPPRSSDELLVRGAVVSTPIHVKVALKTLVLGTATASRKGLYNHVSRALENSVPQSVQKAVNSPEFMGRFLDAIVDNPALIIPGTALIKSEQ